MNLIRAKFSHGVLFIAMPKEAVMENHFIWEKKQEREYKALLILALQGKLPQSDL